jgi:uncharacterized membrane protein YccC
VTSVTGQRRPARVPGWLIEIARPASGPVPWPSMGLAALGIGVPLAAGLAAGQLLPGVLAAVGGLVGVLADRPGPYPVRLRRILTAGVFGGAAGLLLGTAINGRGWVAVAVLIVAAAVSAMISSASATWSLAGLYLLVYAALATGPLGTLRPWPLPPLWLLAGVGWTLLLLTPGWLLHPRAEEQRRIAAVYRALAVNLRALGTGDLAAARQGVIGALNLAFEELLGQRAAVTGRDRQLAGLVALLNQARLAAEAAAALAYTGGQLPAEIAGQADALAQAAVDGSPVAELAEPSAASPAVLAVYSALNGAARVVSGGGPDAAGRAGRPGETRRRLPGLAAQARGGLTTTFTIRLMLCTGVAAVCSQVLPLARSYWVVLAVVVVLKPDFGSVFARALQYAAGTVLGSLLTILILADRPPDWASLAWVTIFALALPYAMSRNYGLWTVFFTPLVVLVVGLTSHGGIRLGEDRLVDVLLGCGIVLLIGYAPWPSSWHASLPRQFASAAEQAAQYLQQALGQPDPGTAGQAHACARKQAAALRVDFQRALAEPQHVRHQVVAWWPAVVALEWLLEAVTATAVTTAGQPPPTAAVSELAAAVARIASAARSGTPVPRQPGLPRASSLELVSDAVQSLADAFAQAPPHLKDPLVPRMSQPRRNRAPGSRQHTRSWPLPGELAATSTDPAKERR